MSSPAERLSSALADRYRIERELGQGGMATVYLARDLKHDRDVAIKMLKPELAAVLGAERFVQEIKTTAALSHPHILPLFDSGVADGQLYYVMPYIQGETIRDKLNRETQFGVDEAVKIATEVADALDYAHRHGVIHRDIKPENILLHDGRPMVMDFGIALALSAAAGGRMTETGLSLGTPHYMSPEQATADKDITARSDIYSLATVLYEMLAGEPPHTGNSAQQIIMKIVTEDAAPVTRLRKAVPPNVSAALAKALEKLPADRFDSAKAFADALADSHFSVAGSGARAVMGGRAGDTPALAFRVTAAIALVAIGLAAWGWLRPTPPQPVERYALAFPPGQGVAPSSPQAPAMAPDGSFMVYVGPVTGMIAAQQAWIKRRDQEFATPIPGTIGATDVAVSPDGKAIAFTTGRGLKTLSLAGGAPVNLADSVATGFGIAWLDDGSIAYSGVTTGNAPALRLVPAAGGPSRVIASSDSLASIDPAALPDSRGIVFRRCGGGNPCSAWVYDMRRGTVHLLAGMRGVFDGAPQYAASGQLLYLQSGVLMAAPFDLSGLRITGAPTTLGDSALAFSLSPTGTLLLYNGAAASSGLRYELVWLDRSGRETPVDTTFTFRLTVALSNAGWALSPDGKQLAIGLHTEAGDNIWVKPLPSGPASRITFNADASYRPRWTPDGRRVIFASNRLPYGMYERRADGTGTDSLVVRTRLATQEGIMTRDGAWLLVRDGGNPGPGGRDILAARLGVDTSAGPLLATPFDEEAFVPSPDSHWLAYQSDETGNTEVFIRSFPEVSREKRQVSSGGGRAPLWSRDGRELYFLNANNDMMATRVTTAPGLVVGTPVKLFHVAGNLLQMENTYYTPWDVAPDGRFLMVRAIGQQAEATASVVVVEHFLQELRARLKP
ncbi:MAG TPA: protein kinase [Gemmatimonadaceae bacterium]|nr:protein kinase [Gemmatimonadaceae bacterium]